MILFQLLCFFFGFFIVFLGIIFIVKVHIMSTGTGT